MSQNQTKPPSFSEEFKVVALRECPLPEEMKICVEPQQAVDYWRLNIVTCPYFNPECECFVVLLLNTRKRVRGHQLVSFGTMNTVLVHPREVFRVAVICGAANIILMHNLCASTHKLCYVAVRVMCSARCVGLALLRLSMREGCCGCA